MIVHQALHGYARGHRRLAESVELTSEEQHRLDLLSDLSGYPDGREFTPYISGYPNGRFYVIARTAPDLGAERDGTVWTHSLLLPLAETSSLPTLGGAVEALHRGRTAPLPTSIRTTREIGEGEEPPMDRAALDQLVGAWFFDVRRPLVWLDPASAIAATLHLWRRLPAEHRASLAFCTNALQGRWIDGRPFDWLGMEPRRTRHLGDLAVRAVFAGESSATPSGGGTYLRELGLLADPERTRQCWERARDRGMAPGRVPMPVLLRYELLRTDGFSGRVACLDLARHHEASGDEISAIFTELLDEPAGSTPRDALTRALQLLVRLPGEPNPELRARVSHWLAPILSNPAALGEPNLIDRLLAESGRWFGEIAVWLAEACATASPDQAARLVARSDSLLPAVLGRLNSTERMALVRAWPEGPDRPIERLVAQAEALGDLSLLLELPADDAALAAAERISEREPDSATTAALLARVETAQLLAWLSADPKRLRGSMSRSILARLGAEHAFLAWLSEADVSDFERLEILSRRDIRSAVRDKRTAGLIWRVAQGQPTADRALVEQVLEVLGGDILGATLHDDRAWRNARWATEARQQLAEPLVRAALGESGWMASPLFATVVIEERERVFSALERSAGLTAVLILARHPAASLLSYKRAFKLLRTRATDEPWTAPDAWVSILGHLDGDWSAEVASLLYWSTLPSAEPAAGQFAAVLLRIVYPVSHEERPRGWLRRAVERAKEVFNFAGVDDWDTQGQLRTAFVQAWARHRWPPEVLQDACPDERAWELMQKEIGRQPDASALRDRLARHFPARDPRGR